MRSARYLALVAALLPSCLWAQNAPQGPNMTDMLVLGKCMATYRQSDAIEIQSTGKLVFHIADVELPMQIKGQSVATADGRFLCSMQMESMGQNYRLVVAGDGKTITEYLPDTKQYAVYPISELLKKGNDLSEFALGRAMPILPLIMTIRSMGLDGKSTTEAELALFRALDITKVPTMIRNGEPIYTINFLNTGKPNEGNVRVDVLINTHSSEVRGMQVSMTLPKEQGGFGVVYDDRYDCKLNSQVKPDQLQLILPADAVKAEKLPSMLEKLIVPLLPLISKIQGK